MTSELPFLADLPRVELAKLMSDLHMVEAAPGKSIPPLEEPHVFFVVEGRLALRDPANGSQPLLIAGPGEIVAPLLLDENNWQDALVPLVPTRAYRLSQQRLQRLLDDHPFLERRLRIFLAKQLGRSTRQLADTRRMLGAYLNEVWGSIPDPHERPAAGVMPASNPPIPTRERTQRATVRQTLSRIYPGAKTALGLLLPVAAAGTVLLLYPASSALSISMAVLLGAAVSWLLGIFPDWVTALAAVLLLVVLGASPASVALSGFSNPAWVLLLGVLGIGVAVARSGLLYRIALHMLRILPPTYRGQAFALALTGLIFTPLLPSANSRSALGSPLSRELSDAMRFTANGNGSAGLAMSSFLGFGQMYFLFMNGTNICLLAWSLLPPDIRAEISWTTWLLYALPLGLLTFGGCFVAILLMLRPETVGRIDRNTIAAQLRVLGAPSRAERRTAAVLVGVLAAFVGQPWHGVDPGWVALSGFLTLVLMGVVDKNGAKQLDWNFLLLVGALVSLSEVTRATGLTQELTHLIEPLLHPLRHSAFLFLCGVACLTLLVRLAVPIQQAVLVMILALMPLSADLGYHPFVVALTVLALSNAWILPQQNSMYLTVHASTEGRSFTHAQVRPLSLVHAAIGVLAVLASIPYWSMLGLLPTK